LRHFLLEDFPSDTLAGYGIGARHSDMFLSGQIDATPDNFLAAAKLRREGLKIPPKSIAGYLTTWKPWD
jgi:hypothetical protein